METRCICPKCTRSLTWRLLKSKGGYELPKKWYHYTYVVKVCPFCDARLIGHPKLHLTNSVLLILWMLYVTSTQKIVASANSENTLQHFFVDLGVAIVLFGLSWFARSHFGFKNRL